MIIICIVKSQKKGTVIENESDTVNMSTIILKSTVRGSSVHPEVLGIVSNYLHEP